MTPAQKARIKRMLDQAAEYHIIEGGPAAKNPFHYAAAEMYEDAPKIAAEVSRPGEQVTAAELVAEVKQLMEAKI